jgi:thymidylate synthase (FAD)
MREAFFKLDAPTAELWAPLARGPILAKIAAAGRICYDSGPAGTEEEAAKFVKALVDKGHESVIEHCHASFIVTCSRACSHQIVRHRLCSYSQESQRYKVYKDRLDTYLPVPISADHVKVFAGLYNAAYNAYSDLIKEGLQPQAARLLLPNGTLTRLMVTANLRQWRRMIELRTSEKADAEIRELFTRIRREFQAALPEIFGEAEE